MAVRPEGISYSSNWAIYAAAKPTDKFTGLIAIESVGGYFSNEVEAAKAQEHIRLIATEPIDLLKPYLEGKIQVSASGEFSHTVKKTLFEVLV